LNTAILNIEIQEFINTNLDSNVTSLVFKGSPFGRIETKALIEQIEAKKKCKVKLPTWFNTANIYYPNKLNIEQTSSEITAEYKSNRMTGESIIDLTGGFGVDCYYFSKQFKKVTHCEINEPLSDIVKHNYKQFGVNTIETFAINGVEYLKSSNKHYDWIYVDPSRRHDSKGKVFFLKDCLPNIPKELDVLFQYSDHIMIKTSPLLDITMGLNELKHVKTIHVIAVNNEVKELLWILEKGFESTIGIETVNMTKNKQEHFSFNIKDEAHAEVKFSLPLTYLYEPNSAILKSGAFKSVSEKTGLYKLNMNSHLYTLDKIIDFPGRRFKVEKILPYNKQLLKKESFVKANISIRNFPETVQQIRKKLKISEGGHTFLFFTTNSSNEKIVLLCSKLDDVLKII
jgi:hypothetical protein